MVTEHTLAVAAIDEFATTGELTGLRVLADQLAEVGNYHGERRIRVVLARDAERREAVAFFLRMSGRVWGESEQSERLKSAMGMARIERWKDACCSMEWVTDFDYNPNDYDSEGMPEDGFGCVVMWDHNKRPDENRPRARERVQESLWGITFSDGYSPMDGPCQPDNGDDNYRRFVEAELTEELFGRVMCLDR